MNKEISSTDLRPQAKAALLSADSCGLVLPADGERYFSADMAFLLRHSLVRTAYRRIDGKYAYRLNRAGVELRDKLLAEWARGETELAPCS